MLRSAGFTLFARLITAILNFLAVILISRFLGPAERGVCGWYLVVVASTLVFAELAAGPAAGYLMRKYPATMVRKISYVWAVLPVVVITGFFFLVNKINQTEWLLLMLLCWLNAANTIHLHVLLARQKIRLFNGLTILIAALSLVSIFFCFEIGAASAINYLVALACSWGIGFITGLLFFTNKEREQVGPVQYKILLNEGFKYGFANQASHLTSLVNNRLVFFLLPASLLGVYSNALSLGEAMMMIPGSMGQVLYAMVLGQKEQSSAANMARLAWWITIAGLCICLLLAFILPDQLYQFIFGSAFAGVKSYLVVLVAGLVFYSGYLVLSYWQSANGRFLQNLYATLAGLLLNILLSLVLFFNGMLNPQTAAVCLSCGYFIIFLVSLYQFSNQKGSSATILPLPAITELKAMLKK